MISLRITFALVLTSTTSMAAILGRRVAEPEGQRGVVSSIAGSRYLGKQVARRCWLRSGRTTGYAARCPVEFDERDGTFRSPAPVAVYENQIAFQSHLVELDDGSEWQIFPGDLNVTLIWRPDTELKLVRIEDPASSHALIADGNSSVRVIAVERGPSSFERQLSRVPHFDLR